jgi:glutathione S-transferase
MAHPVLWQFRVSHFNEKARWALDFKRMPHVRRSLLAGFHIPRVMWMTGQKSVPVLVLDGRIIPDSTRIIEALEQIQPEPPLYPRDDAARRQALDLEEFFDQELGPHIRRVWFYELLPSTEYSASMIATGARPAAARIYRALFPLVRSAMKMDMQIDAAHVEASRAKVEAAVDRLEAEIRPSGYLVGDQFTVADLTAAALLCPLVIPPEFPYPLPGPLPERAAKFRDSYASRRAFQWVTEIYKRHRGTSAAVAG